MLLLIFLFFVNIVIFSNQCIYAKTYSFTDKNGVIHFTDDPTNIKNSNNRNIYLNPPKNIQGYYSPVITKNSISKDQLFSSEIELAANKYGIDPQFVRAIIKAESNFNPLAVSKKGALGLMQLIPETASRYNVDQPFNPIQNIDGGVRYLKTLSFLFKGNLEKIAAAYNAGESMVIKYNNIPPFKETKTFVKKVISYYRKYKEKKTNKNFFKFISKDGTIIYTDSPGTYLP